MNALKITMYTREALELPLSYRAYIQGMLYHAWHEIVPTLHDKGFQEDGHAFRLFVFSDLAADRYTVTGRTIRFQGAIRLEVRSPIEEMPAYLAAHLAEAGVIRLGHIALPVVDLQTADHLLFPAACRIRTRSPLTVHTTLENGYTLYHEPTSPEFSRLLLTNLVHKSRAAAFDCAPTLELRPIETTLKKRVAFFKGTAINAWDGTFILRSDPKTNAFLYYSGLGSRNSQGFGMFDILEQPVD